MKTKVAILSLAAICFGGSLMAQEIDDMYFSRKDREKLNAAKASESTYSASKRSNGYDNAASADESINPTDTYSARSTNPEYVSRANSEQAATDNQDYYVTDYRNSTANNLNKFNSNYNNWYNSTWYNNGYYGNSMYNGFNSPYYYNSFANPWMSPYYQPGWGSSLSFYYGSPYYNNYYGYGGYYDPFYSPYYGYGSGWGMSYGMGYGYGYPYSGFYSGWGMGYGYGLGSYYYWGGRPTVVVVNNGGSGDNYHGPVYGKRADRGGMTYNHQGNTSRTRQQTAATRAYTPSPYQGNTASNGRMATTSQNTSRTTGQADYYNRTWRSAARQQYSQQPATNYNSNSRSSWGQSNQSQSQQSHWNNSNNTFQHNNSFTPSRSFNSGGGGMMRAPSSGGGLGGRTRGH